MTQTEILNELRRLPPKERREVIEAAIHLLQDDLQHLDPPFDPVERKQRLTTAAVALLQDYTTEDELICFTGLDGENVYASG